jgi:histidyl-tRNA synthetase
MSRKHKNFSFQNPKGMSDILPHEQPYWQLVRSAFSNIASFYNFGRVDTPVLEDRALFEKGIGAATDIVEKEMYTLKTAGGDTLVLRPEGTAPVMRAYIQNGLFTHSQPVRLYYLAPMFRHESPQKWRYRQFHQAGLEVIGDSSPIYDAQVIMLFAKVLQELGITNFVVKINSIGDRGCRAQYRNRLRAYYKDKLHKLSKESRARFAIDPIRVLDSKNPDDIALREKAPVIIDDLSPVCHAHFKSVLEFLDALNIPYHLDPYLVRGLEYYNRTVFEIEPQRAGDDVPGSQSALVAGGRFDYLAELLGGRATPSVGGAMGIERVIEYGKARGVLKVKDEAPVVFVVQLGDLAKRKALMLLEQFRKAGMRASESFGKESIKAQLKVADKVGALFSLIIGQKEAHEDNVIIRDMKSGAQETVPVEKIIDVIRKKVAKKK